MDEILEKTSLLERMEKIRRPLTLVMAALLVLVLLSALFRVNYGFSHFNEVKVLDDWNTEMEGDSLLRMSKIMNADTVGKTVMFYTSDSFVKVRVDGDLLYSYGESFNFCKSPGSLWQFVELPSSVSNYGKTLEIEIQTVYPDKFNTDIKMYCGSSGALLLDMLVGELPNTVTNLILFGYGIILLVIFWLERASKVEDRCDCLLGILCILTCLWSNCELFTFQLILPSGVGQYFLYYMCFFAMPFCLIYYMENVTKIRMTPVMLFHIAMVFVLIFLQYTGRVEFTQSLVAFLTISLVEMVGSITYQVRKTRIKMLKSIMRSLIFLLVCVVVNSILYFVAPKEHISLLISKIGLIIYVTINTYVSFEHLIVSMVKISESEKVREIAYMDQLTQIGNRYAFMQDINTINYQYIGLVSIDLNNLKYYNDNMGHMKGDQLIKDSADILKEVYEGSLYRTGGDEFISITAGKSVQDLFSLRMKLHKKLDEYNSKPEHDILLEIACGFSVYQHGDMSYEDILARADKAMYEDKAKIKAVSPIKSVR